MKHQLPMALRAAYWEMHRASDKLLQEVGVSANQFVVMALLSEHGSLIQQELVQLASSDPNTIRNMLELLLKKGLIKRKPSSSDKRAWNVSLSAEGKRAYEKMNAVTDAFRAAMSAGFSAQEQANLIEMLQRLANTARELNPIARTPKRSQPTSTQGL